jgi:glycerophosphoryl diester phosphodiesterase
MDLWPHQLPCWVIGHRGAMGYAPENTMASFEDAIRRGADWLELDVQLTKDGELVVMHDTSVERTTNGHGLVRDLPLKKIKSFDAGSWYDPEFVGEFVPSLADVLTRFRNRRSTRQLPVGLIIELKTVRGSGGSLADAVVALLQKEQFLDQAVVISFDSVALQEVRAASRQVPTGLLYSDEGDASRVAEAREIGAHAIFPRKTCVTSREVVAAHKAGLAVATWTANTKNEMKRLMTCGVDAIATNFPDRLRTLIS